MKQWMWVVGMGVVLVVVGSRGVALAASGTTLDAAVVSLSALFVLGAYLLGFAGTTGLVYSIAQRTFGLTLDGSIALMAACAVVASWPILGALVGVSAAATLP